MHGSEQMSEPFSQFVGSIPEHYDRGLGPHVFVDYAADLAARVAASRPTDVLELAAGTGIVTRRLRDALSAQCSLIASDLNAPMLDVARKKFDATEAVTFQEVDAMELPFADASFDVIACQFGVMFFPDKPGSFREAHRAIRAGGRYLFSVWDAMEANPFSIVAQETSAKFFEDDPPSFYKLPFSYHDVEEIETALSSAGFGNVGHHHVAIEKEIPSIEGFARGLVYGNPLFQEIHERGGDPKDVMTAIADALEAAFGNPGKMRLSAIVFDAQKD
jgi:ubiquinone/menaquinone biosynthesis C-methylase UbiE